MTFFVHLVLVLTAGNIISTMAQVAFMPSSNEYPGKCVDPSTKKIYEVGMFWPGEGCSRYICQTGRRGNMQIQIQGCGKIGISSDEKCRLVENKELKHPDCCPKIQCNNNITMKPTEGKR